MVRHRVFLSLLVAVAWFGGCRTTTQAPASAPTSVSASTASVSAPTAHLPAWDGTGLPKGVPAESGIAGWWATGWDQSIGAGFLGAPETSQTHAVTVRYSQYSVVYDVVRRTPIWGAYSVDAEAGRVSVKEERPASRPGFGRPGFSVEPLVREAAQRLGVTFVRDDDFADAFDPRWPLDRALPKKDAQKSPYYIERGHIVPNAAMKSLGDEATGRRAQRESFSLANVVPETSGFNAPIWAELEAAILNEWSIRFDRVWVIVGPIFPAHPTTTVARLTGRDTNVPSPDAVFCVIIVKDHGKLRAVAVVVPHKPEGVRFVDFIKTVDTVEAATGINFMPDLGEPTFVEQDDGAWLKN